jgi:hypothetical protein
VDRDTQAANTRLAIALLGVHGNSVKGYGRHKSQSYYVPANVTRRRYRW